MTTKPTLCEPVPLHPAVALRGEVVSDALGQAEERAFPHFHDATELIFFETVSGTLHTLGQDTDIRSGSIVYVPSMRFHDFSFRKGPRKWTVLHADTSLVADLMREDGVSAPSEAFVHQPRDVERERIGSLFYWLADALQDNELSPMSKRLFSALLASLVTTDRSGHAAPMKTESFRSRLRPALKLVAAARHRTVTVDEAAERCHLSRHYFSRSFKQAFGTGFADYERQYRLRRAALRISNSAQPISDIAFEHGFQSPAHFTASFHKRFGVTPSAFRASHTRPAATEASRV